MALSNVVNLPYVGPNNIAYAKVIFDDDSYGGFFIGFFRAVYFNFSLQREF
jgi:hypothetical protein